MQEKKIFCYYSVMEYNLKHYAYIGDAVWELFIRNKAINKTTSQALMHKISTKYVCASFQAEMINKIFDILTPEEQEIQRRGRNLKITVNKRSNPKVHSLATSFEVIIGYLYLNNKERLNEIFDILNDEIT